MHPYWSWLTWNEVRGYLPPWEPEPDAPMMVDETIRQLRRLDRVVGDISFAWLRYIEHLSIHGVRVICMRRDREATVRSYLARKRDLATMLPSVEPNFKIQYESLPKFNNATREENARELWSEFYAQAEQVERLHPESFRIFEMDHVLNTKEGQSDMMQWAGFDNPVLHVGIR